MTSLAEALCHARAAGAVIKVDAAQRPTSVAAAYGVQAEAIARSGLEQVGWKIGAAAQAAIDMLGLDGPFLAPVLAPHCLPNGAEVAILPAQSPGLETEFLVGLGADLPTRDKPWQRDEVAAAVAYVAPSFEVVACRFEGGFPGNGMLAIADGGGNGAIVQGAPVKRLAALRSRRARAQPVDQRRACDLGQRQRPDLRRSDRRRRLAREPAADRRPRPAQRRFRDDRHLHRPRRAEGRRPRGGGFR